LALTIPCSGDEVLDADASQKVGHTRTVVSNGQIMPQLSLQIINPQTLTECPSHHIGEIWIAGPSITRGYWQKPDKNKEAFVFRDGLRFFRTGDLGFLDSQQRLYITGRLKDLIVIDGKNYYPQDIEETVKLSHPALQEVNCAVFSISGTYSQKLVVVNEVLRRFYLQIDRYADEIKEAVKTAIYNHYELTVHETVLLPLNSIPKTTSGKIQRQRPKLLYLLQKLESIEKVTEVSEG
jgi:acyl-CoA synthetase (AMP-forming)/AMP-acid ligase II